MYNTKNPAWQQPVTPQHQLFYYILPPSKWDAEKVLMGRREGNDSGPGE